MALNWSDIVLYPKTLAARPAPTKQVTTNRCLKMFASSPTDDELSVEATS